MGLRNLRAICPNCGGKIHTQPKGLGHLTWANSWLLVETGKQCQHCGVALTGRVKADNKAELARAASAKPGPTGPTTPRRTTTRLNGVEVVWVDGKWQPLDPEPSMPDESSAAEPTDDPTVALRKLGELRDAGVLTDDEFATKKAELLKRL